MTYATTKLLDIAITWSPIPQGFQAHLFGLPRYSHHPVSFAELDKHDERLVGVMREMLQHRRRIQGDNDLPGSWVRLTLKHWDCVPGVDDIWGNTHYVSSFFDARVDMDPGVVVLNVSEYDLQYWWDDNGDSAPGCEALPEPVPYAVNNRTSEIKVEASWMDSQFPRWRDRLIVARAVGLSPSQKAELLFCNAPASMPVEMNELVFDD